MCFRLWGAPAGNVTQYQPVVEIVPNISGTIIEVPIEGNRPLKKGDLLFKIDPRPYQYKVEQIKAALAEAEQAVPQLEAVWKGAVAATATAKAKAQRDLAKVESDMASKARGIDTGAINGGCACRRLYNRGNPGTGPAGGCSQDGKCTQLCRQ